MTLDRNAMIRKIQVARRQLFGDDEALYRASLPAAVGKDSLKAMTPRELERVLEAYRKKGWKAAPAKKARAKVQTVEEPMDRKIRALWISLEKLGAVKVSGERSMRSWIKRMTGMDDLRFVPSGEKWLLIEALKKWVARAEDGEPAAYSLETVEENGVKHTRIVEETPHV